MYCTVLYDILLVIYNKAGCCASGRIKAVRWRSQFTVVATEACPDTGATRRYIYYAMIVAVEGQPADLKRSLGLR